MTSKDPDAYRIFSEIGIIHQLATHEFTQSLPRGMTTAQFGILNHFVRLDHGWRTPAQLAKSFQVSRPTMSNTLARMEKAALIEVIADPDDGRGKRVRLTDKGRAMREDCILRLAEPLARVQSNVSPALIEKALPLLTELRQILDRMRE